MSHESTKSLTERTDDALADDYLRAAVAFTTDRLRNRKTESAAKLGDWEAWRERGRDIRSHTVAHLDYYLDQFSRNMEANGGHVHFAADAAEAQAIVLSIAKQKYAKLVAKSKSMLSEEVHINHALEEAGIKCIETDLGEWIIQLAGETPSHIIIPSIHKNRDQIKDLFEAENGETLSTETSVLAGYARKRLRSAFQQADIGMTGCNFAIADSGSVVIFSNEGNARMVTTLPKTHIVMMGMERILPGWADLEVMANLLPRSASGQKMTAYMTGLSGPRRAGEIDGPDDVHVVVLDNGRSGALGDPEFRDILNCIRCGACLNVCPVYRQVGGHAYGSVYGGPIGAVLTPILQQGVKKAGELAYASSLCGACHEACPVKIPLHDMLVHLRRRYVEAGFAPAAERDAFAGFGKVASSPGLYRAAGAVGRWVQLNVLGSGEGTVTSGKPTKAPRPLPVISGWTNHRDLPVPPKKAFRDLWLSDPPSPRSAGTHSSLKKGGELPQNISNIGNGPANSHASGGEITGGESPKEGPSDGA